MSKGPWIGSNRRRRLIQREAETPSRYEAQHQVRSVGLLGMRALDALRRQHLVAVRLAVSCKCAVQRRQRTRRRMTIGGGDFRSAPFAAVDQRGIDDRAR